MSRGPRQTPFDTRVAIYRTLRTLLITAAAAFAVKFLLFDTVAVRGNQMAPTLVNGDRLLLMRLPFLPLTRHFFKPPCDKPVVFQSIATPKYSDCLRVVAISGDTVRIDSGTVISSRPLRKSPLFNRPKAELIPKSFAPRDFFNAYRVPAKNDVLFLGQMSLRDFFFARSVIAQEHPKSKVAIKPYVMLDDSACSDYIIADFTFYGGRIDSVPDSLCTDWFFWSRLEEYLVQRHSGRRVSLYFTLSLDNTALEEYRVSDDYCFMLADNRASGLDSRNVGPVGQARCTGGPVMVLWSTCRDDGGKRHLRFKRLGRFIS